MKLFFSSLFFFAIYIHIFFSSGARWDEKREKTLEQYNMKLYYQLPSLTSYLILFHFFLFLLSICSFTSNLVFLFLHTFFPYESYLLFSLFLLFYTRIYTQIIYFFFIIQHYRITNRWMMVWDGQIKFYSFPYVFSHRRRQQQHVTWKILGCFNG